MMNILNERMCDGATSNWKESARQNVKYVGHIVHRETSIMDDPSRCPTYERLNAIRIHTTRPYPCSLDSMMDG